jgi:opacity protein-like surface antigen
LKRLVLVFFAFSVTVMFSSALPAIGAEKPYYFTTKAGIYSPGSDDLDTDVEGLDFDTEFIGGIAVGYYFNPNLAVEFGIDYFQPEVSRQGTDPIFGDWREHGVLTVIPVRLTGKGIYPVNNVELFGEVGIGISFSNFEIDVSYTGLGGGSLHYDVDDTDFEFHLGLGANYNINENIFLGVEGKYLWADAQFPAEEHTFEPALDGFVFTLNLGFRF